MRGDETTEKSMTKECFECISKGNAIDCLNDPKKDAKCTSKEYCYIYTDGNSYVGRGCVKDDDLFVKDKEFCEQQPEKCLLCSENAFCNGKKIQEEHCINTEYGTNNVANDQQSKVCPMKTLRHLGCYHMEKNNYVKKGCMSDLDEKMRIECHTQSNDCEICFGDNCNSKVVRHRLCIYCSDESDINCAEPSELYAIKDFSNISSSCLVGIDKDGYTHRLHGTNVAHDNNQFPNGFDICHSDSCNNIVYPSNRLKCFQCQGEADCDFQTNVSKEKSQPKVCEIYSTKDECYTYFDEGKFVEFVAK